MLMSFINHENHIKKRASLHFVSYNRSPDSFWDRAFCALFKIKKQMMFDTLPFPSGKERTYTSEQDRFDLLQPCSIECVQWAESLKQCMPFSLMVMNLGFWGGGIHNLLFSFSLRECKSMLFLSWKTNFHFIIHPRNCSTVFLKHRIPAHEKHFRIVLKKSFFLSFICITGLGRLEFRSKSCPYLGVTSGVWEAPFAFGVEGRIASKWRGYSIEYSRKRIKEITIKQVSFILALEFFVFPYASSSEKLYCLFLFFPCHFPSPTLNLTVPLKWV